METLLGQCVQNNVGGIQTDDSAYWDNVSITATPVPAPVPVPSTAYLLGTGMAALGVASRTSKRNADGKIAVQSGKY